MKSQITLITLGVDNLERALKFYRDGLGFPSKGIVGNEFEHGAVVFFNLQPGLKLAVWLRDSIAHDTGIQRSPASPTDLTLGYNVTSKQEVDDFIERARKAGAVIVKEPHDAFWGGYSSYFQDPDQHVWEVVWNPNFQDL